MAINANGAAAYLRYLASVQGVQLRDDLVEQIEKDKVAGGRLCNHPQTDMGVAKLLQGVAHVYSKQDGEQG